ncbi:hypothetical protein RIF29_28797 [Crotalaria pallida]|uniref:TORTIFOLIA1/TORL1-2 C-terminal domain-containing protein n=1 Tax=Crotalaria pallida TaxID=3830 RepID=A0AAN9EDT5_CROPI
MNLARDSMVVWKSYKVTNGKNFTENDNLSSSIRNKRSMGCSAQMRKNDDTLSYAASRANGRIGCSGSNTNYWKCVKRLACEGDLNSAYNEALHSHDELILVELLNRTGLVIESLS